jgi:hypothetical protein
MPTQVGSTTTDFDNTMTTVLTTSYTQASGGNGLLVVMVSTEGAVSHNTVTFDGQSLTKEVDSPGTQRRTTIWTLVNPPVTTANIVVSIGNADVSMIATSWIDVNQTTPVSNSAVNSGNSATPSVVVNSAAGELVLDNFSHNNDGNDPVVGAGQTELADVSVIGDFRSAASREDGAAPNVTMDWSGLGSGFWSSAAISLAPAAAPAAPGQTHQMII